MTAGVGDFQQQRRSFQVGLNSFVVSLLLAVDITQAYENAQILGPQFQGPPKGFDSEIVLGEPRIKHSQIAPSLAVRRIELDGLAICLSFFLFLAELPIRHTQVEVGISIVRSQPDGLPYASADSRNRRSLTRTAPRPKRDSVSPGSSETACSIQLRASSNL